MTRRRVLFFEPWYGGSHRAFLDAWARRSRHRIEVRGLAPRHWKWRQESSGWELARGLGDSEPPEVIACSDFVDLGRLMGFLPPDWASLPTLAYFHENQLTYGPDSPREDVTYGFSNILTAVRSDVLVFNSAFHRDAFRAAATRLLKRLPKPNPRGDLESALGASLVIPPAPELDEIPLGVGAPGASPLRVVFPHRLEPDKRPIGFLQAVQRARERCGDEIQVILLGGEPSRASAEIQHHIARAANHVLHAGRTDAREDYLRWLGVSDVVASTASHEFFGVAFAEAMSAGCTPLAPDRLNYPSLVQDFGLTYGGLYGHESGLTDRLAQLARPDRLRALRSPEQRAACRHAVAGLDAGRCIPRLDDAVDQLLS